MHIERIEKRLLMAAGQLDTSYGTSGILAVDVSSGQSDQFFQLAQAPNGKIVGIGTNVAKGKLELARFNASGTLDTSFGGGDGIAVTTVDLTSPLAGKARIDVADSGRIAVSLPNIFVFKSDGTLDTAFSGDGALGTLSDFTIHRIALAPDGKLVITGQKDGQSKLVVRRYNANGTIDSSFGDGGDAVLSFDGGVDDLDVTADGKVVVATSYVHVLPIDQGGDTFFASHVSRLTAAGDPDSSFGNSAGIVSVASGSDNGGPASSDIRDIVARDDGSVYVLYEFGGLQLDRITDAGSIDPDFVPFDANGTVPNQIGVTDTGWIIASNGQTATRYTPNAWLDRSYGTSGVATLGATQADIAVNGDGTLLVGDKFTPAATTTADDWIMRKFLAGEGANILPTLNKKGTLIFETNNTAESIILHLRLTDGRLVLRNGDFAISYAPSRVKRIAVFAHAGADSIKIDPGVKGVYVDGGEDSDTINGGQGGDVLLGGTGRDQIFGNDGDDTCLGGGANDYIVGGAGKDDLFGNSGVDTLSGGGGNDRLFGGAEADRIIGGPGFDLAANDDSDIRSQIEALLDNP